MGGYTSSQRGRWPPERERASCLHGVPSISLTCHLTPVAAQCHLLCPVVYECLKQTVSSLNSQQLTISIDIIAHTYSAGTPTHPPTLPTRLPMSAYNYPVQVLSLSLCVCVIYAHIMNTQIAIFTKNIKYA